MNPPNTVPFRPNDMKIKKNIEVDGIYNYNLFPNAIGDMPIDNKKLTKR